jgi:hypothetical protein
MLLVLGCDTGGVGVCGYFNNMNSNPKLTNGNWGLVTFVYNGPKHTMTCYIDGTKVTHVQNLNNIDPNPARWNLRSQLLVFASINNSEQSGGFLRYLRVLPKASDEKQVSQFFQKYNPLNAKLAESAWHSLIVTTDTGVSVKDAKYEQMELKVWIDGKEQTRVRLDSLPNTITQSFPPLWNVGGYGGQIRHVALWRYALNEEKVNGAYRMGLKHIEQVLFELLCFAFM